MKTLFIERIYLHGQGGGANVARAYINALAELSEEFTLVYPLKEGKEAEYLSDKITNLIPSLNDRSKIQKGILTLCGKLNFLHNLPEELFEPNKFDLVVFSGTQASQGLIKKFRKTGAKIATLHHNYEFEFIKDNSTPLFKVSQLISIKRAEKKAIQGSDLNLCLTADDIELFKVHYDKNANYALSGSFDYQVRPEKQPTDKRTDFKNFVITGDLSFNQTSSSLIPWIQTYFPILKEIYPDSNLIIAGRNPSPEIVYACKTNGIELIASPKNMDDVLCRGDYYICPVALGGGIKIRCMDGLKWGMPVLAHKVSARGYQTMIENGVFRSYDSPESFKKALQELVSLNKAPKYVIDVYNSYFSYNNGKNRMKKILEINNILK